MWPSLRNLGLNARLGLVVMGLTLGLVLMVPPQAQATTWYLVAEKSQGQEQQFIDLDSIEPGTGALIRVKSYYLDRRTAQVQRTDYLTEYHCKSRTFRDAQRNGVPQSSQWFAVDPDPLNAAAMTYVCALLEAHP